MDSLRIGVMSDVHTEMRENTTRTSWCHNYPLDLGPSLVRLREWKPHALVLAGDIGRVSANNTDSAVSVIYARQAGDYLGCPVVLVPGNDEYYGQDFDEARTAMLASSWDRVRVLDRGEAILDLDGTPVRFLGATMWIDYAASGDVAAAMSAAASFMNDQRLIKRGGKPFTPHDALAEHSLSRAWLRTMLREPHRGPTLVVTHHVPHTGFRNPHYPLDHLTGAFTSNMDTELEASVSVGVAAWIYGHHHWCGDMVLRGMRMASFQVGYQRESTGWTGPGMLDIQRSRNEVDDTGP